MVGRQSHVWAYLVGDCKQARERIKAYASNRFPKSCGLSLGHRFWIDPDEACDMRLHDREAGAGLHLNLLPGDHLILDSHQACRSSRELAALLRLCRERCVTAHILDLGLDTSSAQGRNLLCTIEALAKLDRERRSKAGRRSARRPAPIGWRYVGPKGNRRLIADERERRDCLEIVRLHDEAALSFESIWLLWGRQKKQSKHGRTWSEGRIKRGYRCSKANFQIGLAAQSTAKRESK